MASNGTASIKVGVLSMGDMGAGIARMLIAHGFPVATNCQGRSEDTIERARNAGVELLSSDVELVQQCALIISVLPPRDAEATAQRVIDALSGGSRADDLYFADVNAVSPRTCKGIAASFEKARVPVRFIDGCILGGPPRAKAGTTSSDDVDAGWTRPRVPVSGPYSLKLLPNGERLESVLNFRSISPEIGAASGLKMCFAAISKGFTALATQSLTTAHHLGVADDLRIEMEHMLPKHLSLAEGFMPAMPPKAYRWVREMEEIADTMHEEGGWARDTYAGIAGIYKAVADDEVLGIEKVGKRKRGTTAADVAALMSDGLDRKRKKTV